MPRLAVTVCWDQWAIEACGTTQASEISLTAWIARHLLCWPCAFGVGFGDGLGESADLPVGACVGMGSRQPSSAHERRSPAHTTPRSHALEQMSLWL